MSQILASEILQKGPYTVMQLVDVGAIDTVTKEDGRTYALLDPAATSRTIYDEAVRSLSTGPHDAKSLLRYKLLRTSCNILASEPHPDAIVRGAFEYLHAIRNFSFIEFGGVMPLDLETYPQIADRFAEMRGVNRTSGQHYRDDEAATREEILAVAPGAIAGLSKSCVHPVLGHRYDAPTRGLLARIDQLDRLSAIAILHAVSARASGRSEAELRNDMIAFERVEHLMTISSTSSDWNDEQYGKVLETYVRGRDLLPLESAATRLDTLSRWLLITRKLMRAVAKSDPEYRAELSHHLPPEPKFSVGFRKWCRVERKTLAIEGGAKRKVGANFFFEQMDLILNAARNRRDQIREIGEAIRAHFDSVGASPDEDEAVVEVDELDALGFRTGNRQLLRFRLWYFKDAWQSVTQDPGKTRKLRLAAANGRMATAVGNSSQVLIEFVGTEMIGVAPRTNEPWVIQFARLFPSSAAGYLPEEIIPKRHDFIRQQGLPGYYPHPTGLLGFIGDPLYLARMAALQGRIFVPVEEFEHAVRLGYAALDVAVQSMRRGGEVTQLVLGKLKPSRERPDHFQQKVTPKGSRHLRGQKIEDVPLTIHEETVEEALNICELQKRRCGMRELPIVRPPHSQREKLIDDRYVFSFNGQALELSHLRLFIRYLLAGWPPFYLHHVRHGTAQDANADGEPEWLIGAALGHESPQHTAWYMRLPDWAREMVDERQTTNRMKRQDARQIESGAVACQ
jgi:hypothetical protein